MTIVPFARPAAGGNADAPTTEQSLAMMRRYVVEHGADRAAGFCLALAATLPPSELADMLATMFEREKVCAPLEVDQPDGAEYAASIDPEARMALSFFLHAALPAPLRHRLLIELVQRRGERKAADHAPG